MKEKTVITPEKHEVWAVRQIPDTTGNEQEDTEHKTAERSSQSLARRPDADADKDGVEGEQ